MPRIRVFTANSIIFNQKFRKRFVECHLDVSIILPSRNSNALTWIALMSFANLIFPLQSVTDHLCSIDARYKPPTEIQTVGIPGKLARSVT